MVLLSTNRLSNVDLQDVTQKIIKYFYVVDRPVFLGELSIELRYDLQKTEQVIDVLLEREIVRHANDSEIKAASANKGSALYVLLNVANKNL